MKYLFLFDIDGTLLKFRDKRSRRIFSSVIEDIYGVECRSELMPDFSGMTDLKILRDIARAHELPLEPINSVINDVWEKLLIQFREITNTRDLMLLPGVDVLLESIDVNSDITKGLLTGNFKQNAYLKLGTYKLEKYFTFGAFGSDKENRNDLPELAFRRAEVETGARFTPDNTIIIGDSPRDIECGRVNNIKVLSVATGNFTIDKLQVHNPDLIIEDMSDYNSVRESFRNLGVDF